jgi:molybdenum cofactor biosynthesis enzyme MoaA
MENRVPAHLSGRLLTVAEYCRNLDHLVRNGLKGIAFTGGEPTLNPHLPELIRYAAKRFERVELTSNGRHLDEMLPRIAPHLHLLKVSLDTTDPAFAKEITNGTLGEVERADTAIRTACAFGLKVAINAVVMRANLAELNKIIELCRDINQRGYPGKAYVSLLDFYYSNEKRAIWEREFVPISELAAEFEQRFGPKVAQSRFGCTFYWFNADGVDVRFKDSLGATHRAEKCSRCILYCQEGIYGVKHSVEGWVTTCPTGDPRYGAHLAPDLTDAEADAILAPLLRDIAKARPDNNSFKTMLERHNLNPNCLPLVENPAPDMGIETEGLVTK